MDPMRTPSGMWILFHVSTGQQAERWSVDARDMLATGEWSLVPPAVPGGQPGTVVDPPGPPIEPADGETATASAEGKLPPAAAENLDQIIPGLTAERKSRTGELTHDEVPPDALRSAQSAPAKPVQVPRGQTSQGKKR